MSTSPYILHRAALQPLLDSPGTALSTDVLASIREQGEQVFADFVIGQGLASLWHEHLAALAENPLSSSFLQQLKAERFNAAAAYLLQKSALATIRQVLDEQEIAHVVFKGAHFRELIYDQPALRVAADIDLLVRPADRFATVEAFRQAGFTADIYPKGISHELTLTKGFLDIDLHWDLTRPGRTRIPLNGEFVEQRRDYGSHWGPTPEATLFLMLVHPVITKYCTGCHSSVIRLLDIVLWMERMQPDWTGVAEMLERAGLKTAAWVMLEWLWQLTGRRAPEEFMRVISPGKWRQRYLANWIARNYSTRFFDHRLLIHLAFILPTHDRLSDAVQAAVGVLRAMRQADGLVKMAENGERF